MKGIFMAMEKDYSGKRFTNGDLSKKGKFADAALLASNITSEAKHLASTVSESMPQVGSFMKKNWKTISAVAAVGIAGYAFFARGKSARKITKR
jgi:hypothetical protein